MDLRDDLQRIALQWPSYGRRRITAELRRSGWTVNPKPVHWLIREDNLLCVRQRKFVLTTGSRHGRPVYPKIAHREHRSASGVLQILRRAGASEGQECRSGLASYEERAGIPVEPATFVAQLKHRLLKVAADADEGFPNNENLTIDGAEATLKRLCRKPEPAGLRRFEKLLKNRMEPVGILEALSDTEDWLNWTRHFGPISGNDRKLEIRRSAVSSPPSATALISDPRKHHARFAVWIAGRWPS